MSKTITKSTAAAKPAAPKSASAKKAATATPAAAAAPVSAPASESAAPAEAPAVAPAPEAPVVTAAAPAASAKSKKTESKITAEDGEAFKKKIASSFTELVKEKTAAGLPRAQAIEVAGRQLDYDFGGAPAEIRALLKEALNEATAAK